MSTFSASPKLHPLAIMETAVDLQGLAIPTFDLHANALFPWSPFAISPETHASSLPAARGTTLHDIPSATDAAQVPIRSE
ncbi:hypothetical protein CGMCC3_g10479 [Colletotrichum fructicola]|nr:uncharacterized protein CGMCC3_g10479 [Colletotrichum fructicola]KAE9573645.1 hypothetical protein CGMCC3_g10479 [Colletotrichum fructicola]